MSRSVAAINQGGEYQALLFWLEAARLFMPYSPVGQVGYEHQAVRSFDDVVVLYSRPVLDEWGDPVTADYYQSKFHVTYNGAFTYSNLIDPAFISAEAVSLLQRLHDARLSHAAEGRGARFYITSPWHVDPNDPLGKIVSATNGELRLDKLFPPGRGLNRLLRSWRSHLNVGSDDELRMTLRPFRIWAGALPLDILRRMVNRELQAAGFRPIQDDSRIFQYTELIRSLHAEGRTLFTQADLREAAERENLWVGAPTPDEAVPLGIRSFLRRAEYMEDHTERMLCLAKYFNGRDILDAHLWQESVYPEVSGFLRTATARPVTYHLYLEAHNSIAFAAGYELDKGVDVSPMQSTNQGRVVWRPRAGLSAAMDDLWEVNDLGPESSSAGQAVAVVLGVTHNIIEDVRLYVRENLPEVGRIIYCAVRPSPSRTAVRDADHGIQLVEQAAAIIQKRTADERRARLHIFASAPNAMIFWLGQRARGFGRTVVYEYDFERNTPGGYSPGLEFPPPAVAQPPASAPVEPSPA
jgi:hypothetical protein